MDGIECSIISKSELERTLRIDSEFYQKRYLIADQKMRSLDYHSLVRYVDVSDGNHAGISDKFTDEGVPYYRGQDSGTFFIENSNPICIDKDSFNMPIMSRSHLKKNDVLLSIVGTIGAVSLVYSSREATCSCKLAILRPKNADNAELLAVFLNSKYGQMQIARYTRGAVQKGLILEDMDQLIMPKFGEDFRSAICSLVVRAFEQDASANVSITDAQAMLSACLDLTDGKTPNMPIAVKKLSESLMKSGRLDAEYYQPKYEGITKSLHTTETVQSICNRIYDDNYVPQEDSEYRYIELANVGNNGNISGVETIAGRDLPSRARRKVRKGQVIISSVEGSLQSCALITAEYDGALCSTGFFVLDSDRINSETLLVLFKSEPVQALLKQRCSGTILTAISKDELLNMPLPYIDEDIQKRIAVKIQESFALRRESKELLEYAKQAVEMAIELGEVAAIAWLNNRVSV